MGWFQNEWGIAAQGIMRRQHTWTALADPMIRRRFSEHRCPHIGSASAALRWRGVLAAPGVNRRRGPRRARIGQHEHDAKIGGTWRRNRTASVHIARLVLSADRSNRFCPLPLPGWPVYAVMASRMQPAAVRAFVDYVSARLAAL